MRSGPGGKSQHSSANTGAEPSLEAVGDPLLDAWIQTVKGSPGGIYSDEDQLSRAADESLTATQE